MMTTLPPSDAEAAMSSSPVPEKTALSPKLTAPQHRPRPLPLFLELLRSETAAEPARMSAALDGLRRYQEPPGAPPRPPAVAFFPRSAARRTRSGAGADERRAGRPAPLSGSTARSAAAADAGGG